MPTLPRRPARPLALALLLGSAAPAFGQEIAAPVRAVTLFEAGLAELTRETGATREVTLRVPLRDVNDVLKSLLVRGEGVTGARLTLDGAQPVEDAFASLPFPPEAATDLVALLRSVPGLRVRVAGSAYPSGREGTLMGVAEECPAEGACRTVLTVLHDDGAIRRHVMDDTLDLAILDPEITDALARGLGALRGQASGTVREVAVSLEGEAVADGALTYVVAAPAWKTAYRALTGGDGAVDLQAWAVVENASGEDWEDVSLTLSSGSPVTLAADLHGRDWRYRPEASGGFAPVVPVTVTEPEAPRAAFGVETAADAAEGFAPAPVAEPVVVVEPQEGVLDSRFGFDEPLDLAAGEMVSLPFLSDALEARRLSLWQGQGWTRTGNPQMVLEVVNDLDVRLPAGIMTVSDEAGGYVGDADFPLVAPGETRAVPFGEDRRLRVEETVSETTRQVSVRAARGVVRIASEEVRETAYLVTSPAGEARELVLDHPLEAGWTTTVAAAPEGAGAGETRQDEGGRRWLRLRIATPDRGEAGEVKVVLRDTYPTEQVVAVGSLDEAAILAFAGQVASEADRAYLEEAATLARAASDARDALAEAEGAQRRLAGEQDRTRILLGSVENPSAAYDRFLAQLLDLEDRIAGAVAATDEARAAAEAAEAAFAAHLEG